MLTDLNPAWSVTPWGRDIPELQNPTFQIDCNGQPYGLVTRNAGGWFVLPIADSSEARTFRKTSGVVRYLNALV
jgi:hypothetical protein